MSFKDTDEWVRYFDSDAHAYYWYNHANGESHWDDQISRGETVVDDDYRTRLIEDADHVTSKDLNVNHSASGYAHPATKVKLKVKRKEKKSSFSMPSSEEVDKEKDNEHVESSEIQYYRRFTICSALLIEQPLCLVEGFLRIVFLMAAIIFACLYNGIFWSKEGFRLKNIYRRIIKDLLLTIAVLLTVLLPGTILCVYKQFNTEREWRLNGFPTIFGDVDSRRFATITIFGAGSHAVNATAIYQESDSLDAWVDSIFIYPRNFIIDLRSFLAGRRNIESLEEGLSIDIDDIR